MSTDPLEGFAEVIEVPVQWGEQDALRHVNHAVYLRWFESSRVAYSRRLGLWDRLESAKVGPILASVTCDYRRPLNYPDVVQVGSKVGRIGRTSLTIEHRIVGRSWGGVAAEGSAVLVLYDYDRGEPCPIPDEVRRAILQVEGRGPIA